MKLFYKLDKFFSTLEKIEIALAATFMAAFTIITFMQVIFRYTNRPLPWVEETSQFLFVWSMFIGSILVTARKRHFSMPVLSDFFPKRHRYLFNFLAYVCVIFVSYILIRYGIVYLINGMKRTSPALGINMGIIYVIMPITGVFCIFHTLWSFVLDIMSIKSAADKGGAK